MRGAAAAGAPRVSTRSCGRDRWKVACYRCCMYVHALEMYVYMSQHLHALGLRMIRRAGHRSATGCLRPSAAAVVFLEVVKLKMCHSAFQIDEDKHVNG